MHYNTLSRKEMELVEVTRLVTVRMSAVAQDRYVAAMQSVAVNLPAYHVEVITDLLHELRPRGRLITLS